MRSSIIMNTVDYKQLEIGMIISSEVKSKEDHGYQMKIECSNLYCFLAYSDELEPIEMGRTVNVIIEKLTERVITVSMLKEKLSNFTIDSKIVG